MRCKFGSFGDRALIRTVESMFFCVFAPATQFMVSIVIACKYRCAFWVQPHRVTLCVLRDLAAIRRLHNATSSEPEFVPVQTQPRIKMTRPRPPTLDTSAHDLDLFTPTSTPVQTEAPILDLPDLSAFARSSKDRATTKQRAKTPRDRVLGKLGAKHGVVGKHKKDKEQKAQLIRGLEAEAHVAEAQLRDAAERGDFDAVADLVSGPNIDVSLPDSKQRTALHLAAVKGHAGIVQLLLLQGASHASKDFNGNTPLHLAVIGAHVPVCLILLQHGASPTVHDNGGRTPLAHAEGRIRMLQARAAQMGALGDGDSALQIRKNLFKEVQQILELLRVFAATPLMKKDGPTDDDLAWVSSKLQKLEQVEEASQGEDSMAENEEDDDLQGVIANLQSILDGMKLQ